MTVIEFCIPMKIVGLIIMCLNKTCSEVCVHKHFCDAFPIQNSLKQGDALSPLLFSFALGYAISTTKTQLVLESLCAQLQI
jgi:hypothetical protein